MKFPKSARLLKRKEFFQLYQEKKRLNGSLFYLDYRPGKTTKLGISVNKNFGKAHERNLFKRHIREGFRSLLVSFPSFEVNVIAKKAAQKATFQELKQALLQAQEALRLCSNRS